MATTYDKASLVMIPSGYKDDKLYSIKPTDGSGDFTFSRDGAGASPATRVNASGLIEKGRENLLLQSNNFGTTWVVGGSVTSGQSGYDGSSDAWLYTTTSAGQRIEQSTSITGVQTLSVYAKAGNLDWILLNIGGGVFGAYFDLANGVVGSTQSASGGVTIDTKIEAIGSGWYRISVSGNYSSASSFRIYTASADGVTAAGNIYIQDAQLESGLVATDYIETTTAPVSAGLLGDMPRLDYSGGATCPSLLLEPSRVNQITQSEYFDGLTKVNLSVTSNALTSPEGVVNASKIVENSDVGLEHTMQSNFVSYTSGQVLSGSVFAKAGERSFVRLSFSGYGNWVGGAGAQVTFDLINGTATPTSGSTPTDYGIEDYGNGWYRCYIVGTSNIAASSRFNQIICTDVNTNVYNGDGTSGLYLYGNQVEASASYPTSYIPTYGSASTRGADFGESVFTENTLAPTGGTTLFIEFESSGEVDTTPNTGGFYLKNNAGTSSHFGMSFGYGDRIYSNYQNGSTIQWDGSIVENTTHKVAFQFIQGGKSFLDGTTKATTSVDWSTKAMGQFELQYGSKVKQAILFPSILTDAECIALTTL